VTSYLELAFFVLFQSFTGDNLCYVQPPWQKAPFLYSHAASGLCLVPCIHHPCILSWQVLTLFRLSILMHFCNHSFKQCSLLPKTYYLVFLFDCYKTQPDILKCFSLYDYMCALHSSWLVNLCYPGIWCSRALKCNSKMQWQNFYAKEKWIP
jgi:hypothetical protein